MRLPGYLSEVRTLNDDGTMSIHLVISKWHPAFWLLCLGILFEMIRQKIGGWGA